MDTWFWDHSQWAVDCPQYDLYKESLLKREDVKEYASIYEVTLTTTKDDPYELRQWARKIADSAIYGVVDMPYCIELTKAGLPHVHAILYSSKKYCDGTKLKSLKYPYRYEFKKVRDHKAYQNYVYKERDNATIKDYCTLKGIPQFDNAKADEQTTIQEEIPQAGRDAEQGDHEVDFALP